MTKEFLKMTILVTAVFLICWFPENYSRIKIHFFKDMDFDNSSFRSFVFGKAMSFGNSMVNPFLYFTFSKVLLQKLCHNISNSIGKWKTCYNSNKTAV